MTKERPILFSGAMVSAILDGRKSQTRRVMKPPFGRTPVDVVDGVPSWDAPTNFGGEVQMNTTYGKPCPYGKPGDRLWVREAWAEIRPPGSPWPATMYVYRAGDTRTDYGGPWKPSIHMPRKACRIALEVTDVRVERLQDISEADALSEGISSVRSEEWDRQHFPTWRNEFDRARAAGMKPPIGPLPSHVYRALWESLNGKGTWDVNPMVWVVEFRRL